MIEYNVNEEKGTVVAYFKDDEKNTSHEYWFSCIMIKLRKLSQINFLANDLICNMALTSVDEALACAGNLYGKAKVHGDDVFDEEKGKEIARMKLLSKYYKAESDAIYYFMKRYNRMVQKMFQNASRIRVRYRNRIKKYAKKIVEIGGLRYESNKQ